MNQRTFGRRSVLAGTSLVLFTAGCLSEEPPVGDGDTDDEDHDDESNGEDESTDGDEPENCAEESGEPVDFDDAVATDEQGWIHTETPPDAAPHLLIVRSGDEAETWLDPDELEDGDLRTFLDETDFEDSFLLVLEYWVTAGYAAELEGVDRLEDGRAYVTLQEADEREDDEEYPTVEVHHSHLIRVSRDEMEPPETACGVYRTAEPDSERIEFGEYVDDDDTETLERLETPRSVLVENTDDEPHPVEVTVTRGTEEVIDETVTVDPGSVEEIEDVAEYVTEYAIVARLEDGTAERHRWRVSGEVFNAVVIVESDDELWITEDVA